MQISSKDSLLGLKSQNLTIRNYFWQVRDNLTSVSILKIFGNRRESIIVRELADDQFVNQGCNLNWTLLAFDMGAILTLVPFATAPFCYSLSKTLVSWLITYSKLFTALEIQPRKTFS